MNKTYPSAVDALRDILKDEQKLAVGGFGLCGIPEALIQAVKDLGAQNVENGQLHPDEIHTPGIYVHRLVLHKTPEKRIEQRTMTAAT